MKKFLCNGKKGFCHDNDTCANCEFFDNSGGEYRDVPLTNADRIRAMSDEELAELLEGDFGNMATGTALHWLKQPAEEE